MTVKDFLKLTPGEITEYLQKINFKGFRDLKLTGLLENRRKRKYKVDKKLYRHKFTSLDIRYSIPNKLRIEISTEGSRVVCAIVVDEKSLVVLQRSYGFFGNANLNVIQGKKTSFWDSKKNKWRWE